MSPHLKGLPVLVLRTRSGIGDGCAEPFPENADEYVALGNMQNGVDETLWAACVEARNAYFSHRLT